MSQIQKPQKHESAPAVTFAQVPIDQQYEDKKRLINQGISKTAIDDEHYFAKLKIDQNYRPSVEDRQRFKWLTTAIEIEYHNLRILNKEQFVALKNIFF